MSPVPVGRQCGAGPAATVPSAQTRPGYGRWKRSRSGDGAKPQRLIDSARARGGAPALLKPRTVTAGAGRESQGPVERSEAGAGLERARPSAASGLSWGQGLDSADKDPIRPSNCPLRPLRQPPDTPLETRAGPQPSPGPRTPQRPQGVGAGDFSLPPRMPGYRWPTKASTIGPR
jgi:hypothetical protein